MLTKPALALAALVAALTCAAPPLAAAQDAGRYGGGRWPAQDVQGRYGRGGYGGADPSPYGRPGGYSRDNQGESPRYGRGRYGRDPSDGQGPLYADPTDGARRPNSLGRDWGEQQREAREGRMQGRFVPLSRVLSDLGRRYPGRQLDAGLEERGGGQTVYRVRWFGQDGRRIDIIVDARTGAVLGQEGR